MAITLGGLGASIVDVPKARIQSLESELQVVADVCDERMKAVSERVSRVLKAFELPRFDNVSELDISVISSVFFSPFPEIALSNQQRKILFIMLFKEEMTAKEIAQHGSIPMTSIFTELYRLEAKGHVVQKPEHLFAASDSVLQTVGLS